MFSLNEKVALVTGGSRGIGAVICEQLASQGAHVVVNFARSEDKALEVVEGIKSRGGSAEALGFDVSEMTAAEKSVAALAKRLGRLDILVANAGIALDGLLLRVKEADFDRTMAVNVKGALGCARGAIKSMMRARNGRVVFVSSVVGEMGNVGQTSYSASKAALLGMMKSLAREYASRNITINAVTPGFIETDMTADLPAEAREAMLAGVPLKRIGAPEDVAAAVAFLASDEAGYITGHALRVNGGMYV
jgi:3-oxoacyl-[acyl-carrier protein] reductase